MWKIKSIDIGIYLNTKIFDEFSKELTDLHRDLLSPNEIREIFDSPFNDSANALVL